MKQSSTSTKLAEIRIDDDTWTAASRERRNEWRVVLDELLDEHRFSAAVSEPLRVLVTVSPGRILFEARPINEADGSPIREEIVIADLEKNLREYLKICIDMGQLAVSANSPNLEALDIAKRLVHNDAARTLQLLFSTLRPDHPTGRRLFTLIVTLHFDTTRLVRPHHLDAMLERKSQRGHRGPAAE